MCNAIKGGAVAHAMPERSRVLRLLPQVTEVRRRWPRRDGWRLDDSCAGRAHCGGGGGGRGRGRGGAGGRAASRGGRRDDGRCGGCDVTTARWGGRRLLPRRWRHGRRSRWPARDSGARVGTTRVGARHCLSPHWRVVCDGVPHRSGRGVRGRDWRGEHGDDVVGERADALEDTLIGALRVIAGPRCRRR